jgi:hypothetical protein
MFCWYWLSDLCAEEKIPFALGHALYMKAIHGSKSKNDDRLPNQSGANHLDRGGSVAQVGAAQNGIAAQVGVAQVG